VTCGKTEVASRNWEISISSEGGPKSDSIVCASPAFIFEFQLWPEPSAPSAESMPALTVYVGPSPKSKATCKILTRLSRVRLAQEGVRDFGPWCRGLILSTGHYQCVVK